MFSMGNVEFLYQMDLLESIFLSYVQFLVSVSRFLPSESQKCFLSYFQKRNRNQNTKAEIIGNYINNLQKHRNVCLYVGITGKDQYLVAMHYKVIVFF